MPDIVTGKTFVDGEKGITATKLNQIISQAVIQPSFVTSKPSSSTLDPTDQLLEVKGAGTYATITGQQLIDSVSASVTQNITPTITAVRLRSFSAVGNPTMECDQRSVGALLTNPANGTLIIDRWNASKSTATLGYSVGRQALLVNVPGTNFAITQNFLRITLTAQQASLAAGDFLNFTQQIEGIRWRELANDVHSLQLLVRSSVAGLKFACSIRDPGTSTKSLVKLCTIPSANTWVLIPLANLPIFPAGNFSLSSGQVGYLLAFCLASGTTFATTPDVWANGNFVGASGMDNFASQTVGSTFDIAFIQHEPGSQCTTPIDCPFTQNYDDCLRYFTKSFDYSTAVGAANMPGCLTGFVSPPAAGGTDFQANVRFPKSMAKIPTVISYSFSTGAANTVRDLGGGADRTVTAYPQLGTTGVRGFTLGASLAANSYGLFHYTADVGW